MFKSSFWGLVAAVALVSACSGEIGALSGDARGGEEPDLVAALSASDGWRSIEASEPAFGLLEFELMARPEVANIDALVAIGAEDINDFSDAAIKVRFADDGFIDARDGAVYDSDIALAYESKVWYRIAISADLATRTYDVTVARRNGRRHALITDAAFDPEATGSNQLTTWAAWSSQGAKLDIARQSWVASGSCGPATCLSFGIECGEVSDGCGGKLSCGGCASDQACTSGVCVDVSMPPPSCIPESCLSLAVECGQANDGCGGGLSCGGCASDQACTSGVCVDVSMPPPSCIPESCLSLAVECGQANDGCGGSLSCGGCASDQACTSGVCVDVSMPPPSCIPESCLSLAVECGQANDGCGGGLSCGGCASDQACTSGVCVDVPPPGGEGQPERPWAHNTGPSNPSILTPYTGPDTITQDGATYENFTHDDTIKIEASNVTLRNFKLTFTSGSYRPGITVENAVTSGVVIEDGELSGPYPYMATAIRGAGFTARRLHIHDIGNDGFKVQGEFSDGPTLIESCFVEKIGMDPESHADGSQSARTNVDDVLFRYNNFWLPSPGTPNYPGAPYYTNACFHSGANSSLANFVIDSNWLNGGNFAIYCEDSTRAMVVTNNRFGSDIKGQPNYHSSYCKEWSGNVWDDTGLPVSEHD